MGAEDERVVVGFAAVEGLAVDESLEVDDDGVAVFGFGVGDDELGVALEPSGDGVGHFLLVDRGDVLLDVEPGVLPEGDLRGEGDGELDLEVGVA